MIAAEQGEGEGEDRLQRFRRWMAQLDPAGDPARAFAAGLYLSYPRAVSQRIAARLEIAPASTHLLIGGVGSGKSTELLAVKQRLARRTTDTRILYLDVSKGHDIAKVAPGVVIVQVGLALAPPEDERDEDEQYAVRTLRHLAEGYDAHPPDYDDNDGSFHVPGILHPPDRFTDEVVTARDAVQTLRGSQTNLVVLIDGLDRMTNLSAFERVVINDVAALTKDGIGVVLVGPLRSLYGIDHATTQRFDESHYQPWIDQSSSPEVSEFLQHVLRKRLPQEAIGDRELDNLAYFSGGVLRDLVALAQLACLEAYMGDSDTIGPEQVNTAIDTFGRNHMQGLRKTDLDVLERVRKTGSFVHTSDDDLALLMTRRVLEYRHDGRPRYVVHPTINQFLGDMLAETS
ncbi:MAG: hypothetical protein H0T76_12005 [Nannocystis sp.]|nr:hypothetical protein [Nannocystis sp.]MBA3547201.1 hypothetical protein [Nannocystis sp.]